QRDLPLLVARPSIVVGHTVLGVTPSASLYWYYRALARAGVSPFPDSTRRDIVPVDWVAEAIIRLLFLRDPKFARYHLSAGEDRATTWSEIREAFARLGEGPASSERVEAEKLTGHPVWTALGFDRQALNALE